jgi:hypothetical protein
MRMRRSSRTSRKPSVVTSAVFAPLRSRIALVATVVACTTSVIAPSPASSSQAPTLSTIARE